MTHETDASHLDTDELATLCDALRWEPARWLDHVHGCEPCRATLSELAGVHAAFPAEEVDEATLRSIGVALREARTGEPVAPRASAATLVTAGLTAFAALVVFGAINPLSAGALLPAAVVSCGIAALLARPVAPVTRLLSLL